jgi:C4-dicarboxylate-specific signal transduction histidine kinase
MVSQHVIVSLGATFLIVAFWAGRLTGFWKREREDKAKEELEYRIKVKAHDLDLKALNNRLAGIEIALDAKNILEIE